MAKISLISLHIVQNYGSALQAYASQVYLEKLGFDVETVDYAHPDQLRENIAKTALNNSRLWNKNVVTRLAYYMLKAGNMVKRFDLFDKFTKQNLKLTEHRYISYEDFEKYPVDADIYCTGSDQTWNTHWSEGFAEPYYLFFAKKGAKKVSYSASFGKTELDEKEKEGTRERLSSYDYITVREQSGVEILKDLGIKSQRILDPTLMMTRDEWLAHTQKPPIKEKYILVYQLSHDRDFDKCAVRLAKEKNLKLIRIGFGKETYFYGGKVILNPDVFEFLSLLANAEYIITDSFHATSFAVNLNVDFFIWLPRAFTSRITDFLDIVGLSERTFNDYEKLDKLFGEKIDFSKVNDILFSERERCEKIINEMLKG